MPRLIELVRERFPELTQVQRLAMPRVLEGQNVLVLAPTGSGKTEAALLPVLEKIDGSRPGIQALYITPLRALGRDMLERFNWWCERLGITHDIRHGDSTAGERARHRARPPQILIITLETLQALLIGRVMRGHLARLRHVILDEVHDVMDNKRGAQLGLALERLERIAPGYQRIALSATVSRPEEAAAMAFGQRPYQLVETGRVRPMAVEVEYLPQTEKRLERLAELLRQEKTLLFVNTRSMAEEVGAQLRQREVELEIHHGSLSREVRLNAEERFKKDEVKALLATSSMELGLDIGGVERVVQYGSPHQVFRLIQRVGRAAHRLQGIPRGVVLTTDLDDRYEAEVLKALAAEGWLEPKVREQGASDVIAHQLVGVCLDGGRIDLKEAHALFARSGMYGISFQQLQRIGLQLHSEGWIYYDESERGISVRAKAGAHEYYYTYLSTIPKEMRFPLRDVVSNRIVASLDEKFVANLEPGMSFLAKGNAWRVIEIEEEVLAEPSEATDLLVPEWVGEDIPVAYEVAHGAAKLRRREEEAPDAEKITLELVQELLVAHSGFGTRVNEALGRILAHRLSQRLGEPCQMAADPYRILVRLPYKVEEKHILEQWQKIGDAQSELEQSLQGSALLRFRFIHVGRLFGLLGPEATVGQRFIDSVKNSIVYQETLRALYFRYFDLPHTQEVLSALQNGKVKLEVVQREKPSPFARIGLERLRGKESIGAFEPRAQMITAFRENLMGKMLELECLHCKATRLMWLATAPEETACHKCGRKEMGLRGKKEMAYSRNLIRNYGKRALLALAAYGVGETTAERILKKLHATDEAFYWDLIEAQKNFIKNKKYWKLD